MLYNNFIVCMMTCAFFAMLNMIVKEEWQYIILPIGIIIWGIFKFFDADDREYLRRNGIDPDEFNSFFPDDYDGKYPIKRTRNTSSHYKREGNTIFWDENLSDEELSNTSTTNYSRYQPTTYKGWQNPAYKGMVKKCKRNFKITIDEESKNEEKTKRTNVFHSSNNFSM